ncbi:uncharacterized protein VNE69_03231 [Vairimorpha necatrix]|uniref:Uncharacterized protein n=1 Tax=Vairimorpha necatrix TaxID=6039 RepID=A0AAX4JAJ7_9MICR
MIIFRNSNEKTVLPSLFLKTQKKFEITIGTYQNTVVSCTDDKSTLYLKNNLTLEIPFLFQQPSKKYSIKFNEYILEEKTVFVSDAVNIENKNYNFVIFHDLDLYPFVYDYLRNRFDLLDAKYKIFNKKIFIRQIITCNIIQEDNIKIK